MGKEIHIKSTWSVNREAFGNKLKTVKFQKWQNMWNNFAGNVSLSSRVHHAKSLRNYQHANGFRSKSSFSIKFDFIATFQNCIAICDSLKITCNSQQRIEPWQQAITLWNYRLAFLEWHRITISCRCLIWRVVLEPTTRKHLPRFINCTSCILTFWCFVAEACDGPNEDSSRTSWLILAAFREEHEWKLMG